MSSRVINLRKVLSLRLKNLTDAEKIIQVGSQKEARYVTEIYGISTEDAANIVDSYVLKKLNRIFKMERAGRIKPFKDALQDLVQTTVVDSLGIDSTLKSNKGLLKELENSRYDELHTIFKIFCDSLKLKDAKVLFPIAINVITTTSEIKTNIDGKKVAIEEAISQLEKNLKRIEISEFRKDRPSTFDDSELMNHLLINFYNDYIPIYNDIHNLDIEGLIEGAALKCKCGVSIFSNGDCAIHLGCGKDVEGIGAGYCFLDNYSRANFLINLLDSLMLEISEDKFSDAVCLITKKGWFAYLLKQDERCICITNYERLDTKLSKSPIEFLQITPINSGTYSTLKEEASNLLTKLMVPE